MAEARWTGYGAAAALFALDRFTKWLIETGVPFAETRVVIPGFFEIAHSQNSGVSFGMFHDSTSPWRTPLLLAVQVAALAVVAYLLWRPEKHTRLTRWGLVAVLGGCAGNLFDRALWGKVTDFLLFYIGSYEWPTFNVADSCLVIGCGLLMLDSIPRRKPHVS